MSARTKEVLYWVMIAALTVLFVTAMLSMNDGDSDSGGLGNNVIYG